MKGLRFALHSRKAELLDTPILAYLSNIYLTLCLLCNFACFFVASLLFFKINFFEKNISGIPSVCQTFWIQIRPDILSGVIWMQTVCKGYPQTTHGDKGLISANLKSLIDRHFRFFSSSVAVLVCGDGDALHDTWAYADGDVLHDTWVHADGDALLGTWVHADGTSS